MSYAGEKLLLLSINMCFRNIFTPGSDPGVCLLSGTRMVHEGALYLIGHFQLCATLEPTLHQARVSTRVNLESLESQLLSVSLKL